MTATKSARNMPTGPSPFTPAEADALALEKFRDPRTTAKGEPRAHVGLKRLETLWCEGLQRFGGPWLAGERFTAVDAFFAPVAVRVQGYDLPLGETALAYAQRLLEHPGVAEWVSQGIAEPWVDAPHEQDCRRGRRVLADRRT